MGRGNRARFSFSRRSQICCQICSLFKPGGLITKTSSSCLGTVITLTYLSALPHVCRVVRTSESVTCRFCGTPNPPGSTKCYKCGTLYAVGLSNRTRHLRTSRDRPGSRADAFAVEAKLVAPFDEQTVKGAHDTDRGLLLLAMGLFLGPIPVIGLLGVVLAFVGAIFVITGREAFGERHSKYVLSAAAVYAISSIIVFFVGASVGPEVRSAFQTTTDPAALSAQVSSIFYGYLVAVAVLGIILGLSTVVFTYAIQDRIGKILLWFSFGLGILLLIPVVLLGGQLSQAVYQATTSADPSPLYAVIDQAQALRLLGLVPAIFYALAYLNARSRISNGEVP